MTDTGATNSDVIMRLITMIFEQVEVLEELKRANFWQGNEITRLTDENKDLKFNLNLRHTLDLPKA